MAIGRSARGQNHNPWRRLTRRQDHNDLAAFETRLLFDLGDLQRIALDPVEQLVAEFLVGHFAAAEAQRHLDLVAFLEEALHGPHLHVIVVIVDHRPQFDFFDLDDFLLFARLGGFFLRLVFVFAEVEDLANRRAGVRSDLHQIEPGLLGHGYRGADFGDALVGAVFVYELDLANADLLVDARPLLGSGLRASDRATNGFYLLVSVATCRSQSVLRTTKQRHPRIAARQARKIGSFHQ